MVITSQYSQNREPPRQTMNFENGANTRSQQPQAYDITNYWIALLPLGIVITVGNSIAVAVFLRKSFLVKKSSYLLVNLTIADLLVGVTGVVFGILIVSDSFFNMTGTEFIFLVTSVMLFKLLASLISLVVISFERVFAVFWPFHHRLAKRCHYFTAIAFVWFASVVISVIFVVTEGLMKKTQRNNFLSPIFVASLILISLSYLSIWIKLTFFTKFRRCRTIQENSKLVKTLFMVTAVSLGTWLPECIGEFVEISQSLKIAALTILQSNSIINIVVYLFRMPEFKKELKYMFFECKLV